MILIALAIGVCLLRLLIDRPPGGNLGFAWPEADYARFRVTAVLMGGLIGAALAVSDVLLQALLRNPLASPWILGLSGDAGLGVMTVMYVGRVTGTVLPPSRSVIEVMTEIRKAMKRWYMSSMPSESS